MGDSVLRELAVKLYDIEAVKFGNFTLKSGIQSPIYIDLRIIIAYPKILKDVSALLWDATQKFSSPFVSVCGVPYTALPIASWIACSHDVPMLMVRKEAKDYGTKKMVEGKYAAGDVCFIIEDVVTTGSSVQETVQALAAIGVVVKDAAVLIDRQQGGKDRLKEAGITLHSVFSISDLLTFLLDAGKIDQSTVDKVTAFLAENQCSAIPSAMPVKQEAKTLSYDARAALCQIQTSKRLLEIMHAKQTNLALSADVSDIKQLLKLANDIGPHICVLKTHVDELSDFTLSAVLELKALSEKHNFLIFEDRKFADIGHTVQQQFAGGVYRISDWADIVDAHTLPGPGVVEGLKQVNSSKGCLLIAQMSSKDNLITDAYTKATEKFAEAHKDFVFGFICTSRISSDPTFLHFTPGVHLDSAGDGIGQQYVTPHEVIAKRHSDIIIVGRGIVKANDPIAAAKSYREAGYSAYLELIQ